MLPSEECGCVDAGPETARRDDDVDESDADVDDRVKLKNRFLVLDVRENVDERFGGAAGAGDSGGESGMLREERSFACAIAQRVHGVWDSAMCPQPEWRTKLW